MKLEEKKYNLDHIQIRKNTILFKTKTEKYITLSYRFVLLIFIYS